jgi:glutamate--cysteine ligase
VALLAALFAEDRITEAALEACGPVADQWYQAAERGLGDRAIARAAGAVLDLGVEALPLLGLATDREALIGAELDRIRLATLGRDAQ